MDGNCRCRVSGDICLDCIASEAIELEAKCPTIEGTIKILEDLSKDWRDKQLDYAMSQDMGQAKYCQGAKCAFNDAAVLLKKIKG